MSTNTRTAGSARERYVSIDGPRPSTSRPRTRQEEHPPAVPPKDVRREDRAIQKETKSPTDSYKYAQDMEAASFDGPEYFDEPGYYGRM